MVSIGSNLVSNIGKLTDITAANPTSEGKNGGLDFKDVLKEAINRFETVGDENAKTTLELLTGNTDDLANTMITAQKAEIAVSLTVAIRNKAVDAYKEIMSMQV